MSFERFSTSDIYIFEHVGGFIECCGCWLGDDWTEGGVEFPHFDTPREALSHLNVHENAGHDTGNARKRITQEYPDLDIKIEPYKPTPEQEARNREVFEKLRAAYEENYLLKNKQGGKNE